MASAASEAKSAASRVRRCLAGKRSIVVAGLKEVDAIVSDKVDEPVFLGQTAGPDVRAEVPKRFRLSEPGEWVGHNGFDKGEDFESHPSVVLDPETKVFSELVLKDAVPTSRDGDGTPPWPGRTPAGLNRGSGVSPYVP